MKQSIILFLFLAGSWSVQAQDANIMAMEYYIDNDPGIGAATAISITSGTTQDIDLNIPTGSLSLGFHVLVVRAMDENNIWSIQKSRVFYISAAQLSTQANITQFEYFFDTDPGVGSGTLLGVTAATTFDLQNLTDLSALAPGFHLFSIRALDSDGSWGLPVSHSFFIDNVGKISNIEYFIDTDPGIGNASQQVISPAQSNIDIDLTVATSSLPAGNYTLGVRTGDTNGNYSFTQTSSFVICDGANADFTTSSACEGIATDFTDTSTGTLTGDTYSWDFESDGIVDDNIAGSTSFAYPSAGTYTASLVIDRSGCKDSIAMMVAVEAQPTANAGADQSICSDNTTLTATTANANETGEWSIISGAGTISDINDPMADYTDITTDNSQLRWTVTNDLAGCSASDEVIISSNQPIFSTPGSNTVALGQSAILDVQTLATLNTGDILTTTITQAPTKGVASVLNNGTIEYTPNAGTVGLDTVGFSLCNQCGNCTESYVVIDIENTAPVIVTNTQSVSPGGTLTIDLLALISDANNNLDLSSLKIVQQPISGATAFIDDSYKLIVDYSGITFVGADEIGIEICDMASACSTNIITIDVNLPGDPPITVYNAISPNGDQKHDFLEIENITAYQNNNVVIFNRWGKKVYEATGYNNDDIKFNGVGNVSSAKQLPGGTYFYRLDLGNGIVTTGFVVLKQ